MLFSSNDFLNVRAFAVFSVILTRRVMEYNINEPSIAGQFYGISVQISRRNAYPTKTAYLYLDCTSTVAVVEATM